MKKVIGFSKIILILMLLVLLILKVVMVFSVSVSALISSETTITDTQGLIYTISGKNVKVTGTTLKSLTGAITIPASVEKNGITYPVVEISQNAFYLCRNITEVNIPGSVNSIGLAAFHGCISLKKVNIHSGIISIGLYAFYNCHSLEAIEVDNGNSNFFSDLSGVLYNKNKTELICFPAGSKVTDYVIPSSAIEIGQAAFAYSSKLKSISIPNSVRVIGYLAFEGCVSLKTINIPDTVELMQEGSFKDCAGLLSINISKGLEYLESDVFSGCKRLASINIGNNIKAIGHNAFNECTGLKSITISGNIIALGMNAFYGCTGLTEVNINEGIKYISSGAFMRCTGLTTVSIPASVEIIEYNAFSACTKLTEIKVSSQNAVYTVDNGILYDKVKTTLLQYPAGKTGTSFTIPGGVTSIGFGSFFGCNNLTSVTLSQSVDKIERQAFEECLSLKTMIFSNTLTSIGSRAFANCAALKSITIPKSVSEIGEAALSSCESINVDADNSCFSSLDGVLYNKDKTVLIQYPLGKAVKVFTVPTGVKVISINAFAGSDTLIEIILPDGLVTIQSGAFYGCKNLKNIRIPSSVTSMPAVNISMGIENLVVSLYSDSIAHSHAENYGYAYRILEDKSDKIIYSGTYLYGIAERQTFNDINKLFRYNITIKDKKGIALDSNTVAVTGDTITVGSKSYTLVIKGDINGDGKVDSKDYLAVKRAYLGTFILSDIQLKAACMGNTELPTSKDYLKIKRHYLGSYDIYS